MAKEQQQEQPKRVVAWAGDHGYDMIPKVREISAGDWQRAGVPADREGLKTVRWNRDNNYKVPVEDLSFLTEHEFKRFIEDDTDFRVQNVEE